MAGVDLAAIGKYLGVLNHAHSNYWCNYRWKYSYAQVTEQVCKKGSYQQVVWFGNRALKQWRCIGELSTIRNNHPNDAGACCTEMFQLWLKKEPKATWKKLMEALKAPGIEMNQLANKIEQILTSITQGNHIAMQLLTNSVSDIGRPIGLTRYS